VFLVSGPSSDVSTVLLEHVLDSSQFHPFPGLTIDLPLGLTVHALMLIVACILGSAFALWAVWKRSLKPRGWALVLEVLIVFLRDDVVYPVLGKERGRRWLPYFVSLFLFILILNGLGLVPSFKAATGNLAVTSALAGLTMVLIFATGLTRLGPIGFFRNLFPSGSPLTVGLFVAFLEFAGLFIKGAVLSLRLFANLFAGHLAILCFLVMVVTVSPALVVVSLPFALFTSLLEVLISLIQALVFALLGCLFLQMASTSHEASD
jgi:F-type H+-transporting ATPase subunit a